MARLARFGWHPLLLLPVIFLTGCVGPYPYGYGYSDYGYPYGNEGYSYEGYSSGYAAPYGYGWPTPGGAMVVPVPVPEYYISGETYVTPSYHQADLPPNRHHRHKVRTPPYGTNPPGRYYRPGGDNPGPRDWRHHPGRGRGLVNLNRPPGVQRGTGGGTPSPTLGRPAARSNTRSWSPRQGAPAGRGLTRPSLPSGNTPPRGGTVQRRPQTLAPAPTAGRAPAASGPLRRSALPAPAR